MQLAQCLDELARSVDEIGHHTRAVPLFREAINLLRAEPDLTNRMWAITFVAAAGLLGFIFKVFGR